jgi:hypothetical protein
MTRLALILSAAFFAGSVAMAGPARADDASYLAKLNASGVPIPVSDEVRLSSGHFLCGELRVATPGYSPVQMLTNTFFFSREAAEAELDAAQTELCPDTQKRPVPNLPA